MSIILLFDLNNTLVEKSNKISFKIKDVLYKIKIKYDILFGIVSEFSFSEIIEKLEDSFIHFDYIFSEFGNVNYKKNTKNIENYELIINKNIDNFIDEKVYEKIKIMFDNNLNKNDFFINNVSPFLINNENIYKKNSFIKLTPIGVSYNENIKKKIIKYDEKYKWRSNTIINFKKEEDFKLLDFIIGDNIDIIIYPEEWNKSQIINYIIFDENINNVFFFGNFKEENYKIFTNEFVKTISVNNPFDVIDILEEYLDKLPIKK
jgi:hypothetical protein